MGKLAVGFNALVVGAALLMTTGTSPNAHAQQPGRQTTPATFDTVPDGRDFHRYYPEAALDNEIEGRVILRCETNLAGFLENCAVVSEDPPGWGFGEASIHVAARFQATPAMRRGRPVRGTITFPIRWDMPEPELIVPRAFPLLSALIVRHRVEPWLYSSWAATPSRAEFEAAKVVAQSFAILRCTVADKGALTGCTIVSEFPANAGVGAAALTLAPLYRAPETLPDGFSTRGGALIFGVDWRAASLLKTPTR